jgi:hypothetical protein
MYVTIRPSPRSQALDLLGLEAPNVIRDQARRGSKRTPQLELAPMFIVQFFAFLALAPFALGQPATTLPPCADTCAKQAVAAAGCSAV